MKNESRWISVRLWKRLNGFTVEMWATDNQPPGHGSSFSNDSTRYYCDSDYSMLHKMIQRLLIFQMKFFN